MNEIPDVLTPLVETQEEDGDPVAECDPECGLSMIYGEMGWYLNLIGLVDNKGGHCPACGTLLGFLSDGTPYRIRHSRVVEALEDLQAAARCAWALLPAAQRVQMYTTSPRLAELASDDYASAEDAQARAIREATEEASR